MDKEAGAHAVCKVYGPSRRFVLGVRALLVFNGVVFVLIVIALVGDFIRGTGVAGDAGGRWGTAGTLLLIVLSFALVFAMTARLLRPRIIVDESGLQVINLLSARAIPWSAIAGFGDESSYFGIAIHLHDGTVVIAKAVQRSNLKTWLHKPARLDSVVAELTEELRRHEQAEGAE